MITLALRRWSLLLYLQAPFTGGEDGIQGVPRGRCSGCSICRSRHDAVLRGRARVFLLGFLLIYRIIHSPFGQVLKAIRENEPRAISLGYRPTATSCWPSCCRHAGRLAGGTKALVFAARLAHRRALDRCRARWC
jgi:branched-chain amino acid transport system permease protein